ncbi:MAG: PstS family phosphate ABC transporter substrate-binding protein [Leptolyngbyaceae cyanobacterium MO_188.B28]|nr:PstS family phosphate ABC transporter substrate-binding protein [Leptolyngbyaceae cyanobacterium MO_188.B28]
MLVALLGGVSGGIWLLIRHPDANTGETNSDRPLAQSATSDLPNSSRNNQDDSSRGDKSKAPGKFSSFADVDGVPTGLFKYGGSTTWVPLRQKETPSINAFWPDFQLLYVLPVSGNPGSGTGIKMLLEGRLDFSQSSRPLKLEEYEEAKRRGFNLEQIPVAIDDISFVVNPDLDISGLTIDDLKGIYTGKIVNWSEVNGPDVPIVPFSRSPLVGGTPEFFIEQVLGNEELGSAVEVVDNTTQGLSEVAANLGGIYYASSPEVVPQCTTKPIPIARSSEEPFVPPYKEPFISPDACPGQRNQLNIEATKKGEYPLTRRLFVIVKKDGGLAQQAGLAYARLILTDQGQQLVQDAGFVSIR